VSTTGMARGGGGHVLRRPREPSRTVTSSQESPLVSSADRQPPQSDPSNRRRARVLIPVGFVVAVVLVMLFIFLVQWLGK
jgi:hypothetical protein